MTAKQKLTAVVAAGVLAVGGGLGGMVAFLAPYQGPDTATAASGQAVNGTGSGSSLTGININTLTGNGGGAQGATQGKQGTSTQNNGGDGKTMATQRAGNGGG